MDFRAYICIFAAICLQAASAKHLPSQISACKKSDPNLKDCAIKNGNAALPALMAGVKSFNIPPLNPLVVPVVEIKGGQNLNMKFSDIHAYGIDKTVMQDFKIDFNKKHVEMKIMIPQLKMNGNYEITGQILVLPINGKGPGVMTYDEPVFTASFDYDLNKKDGKEYMKIKNKQFTYTLKKADYHLENLFNGDANLGAEMNKFLNENWEPVTKELSPVFAESMKGIVMNMFTQLLEQIPLDEIFTN